MENEVKDKKGFYEQRGCVRHTLILPIEHKERLKALAKKYGITQGEVVEEMLVNFDQSGLPAILEARKAKKVTGKTTKTELMRRMRKLTPDQIAAIEAIIG